MYAPRHVMKIDIIKKYFCTHICMHKKSSLIQNISANIFYEFSTISGNCKEIDKFFEGPKKGAR